MAKRPSIRRPGSPRTSGRVPIASLTIAEGVNTVVVFGGSFDPPHRYHIEMPQRLVNSMFGRSGWLLYVPTAQSPLKGRGPIASPARRIAMLKLALEDSVRCSVWTDEIARARRQGGRALRTPSFTIDTLRRLRSILPRGVQLRLLIGADQAAAFHKWRQCRRIIRIAEPIVMPRGPIMTAPALKKSMDSAFWSAAERAAWAHRLAAVKPLPDSSTSVRDAIPGASRAPARWKRTRGLNAISAPVAAYIIKHQLYGFRPTSRAS